MQTRCCPVGRPLTAAIAETTRYHYEGKKLSLAKSATKQPLTVFPELLEEVARSWRDRPYSNRSPIPRASYFDCEVMESLGLLRMPPMELLIAAHLHPVGDVFQEPQPAIQVRLLSVSSD